MGLGSLLMLIICGLAFAGGGIVLSNVLSRKSTNLQKGQAYELSLIHIYTLLLCL